MTNNRQCQIPKFGVGIWIPCRSHADIVPRQGKTLKNLHYILVKKTKIKKKNFFFFSVWVSIKLISEKWAKKYVLRIK